MARLEASSDLFSFAGIKTGTMLKGEGLDAVWSHAGVWGERAYAQILRLPRGWTGMGEDIRLAVLAKVGSPHDKHAWGALVNRAVVNGVLVRTGRIMPPRDPTSHASQKQEWRKA